MPRKKDEALSERAAVHPREDGIQFSLSPDTELSRLTVCVTGNSNVFLLEK